jgi:hypothetical protein
MNLSEEQLSEVQEMAGLFFCVEDVADNLELSITEIEDLLLDCQLRQGEFFKAYRRGWLIAEVKLRKAIEKAAENGSNPAQQMMLNFQKQAQ